MKLIIWDMLLEIYLQFYINCLFTISWRHYVLRGIHISILYTNKPQPIWSTYGEIEPRQNCITTKITHIKVVACDAIVRVWVCMLCVQSKPNKWMHNNNNTQSLMTKHFGDGAPRRDFCLCECTSSTGPLGVLLFANTVPVAEFVAAYIYDYTTYLEPEKLRALPQMGKFRELLVFARASARSRRKSASDEMQIPGATAADISEV